MILFTQHNTEDNTSILTGMADARDAKIVKYQSKYMSPVFAAIEMISNSLAELPLNVKIKKENNDSILADHPLYDVIKFNKMTKFMLLKTMITDMLVEGDALAYIERDYNGKPVNIEYIPPGEYTIEFNQKERINYYRINYLHKLVEEINVIHFFKNTNDGYRGVSLVKQIAKDQIDLIKYTENAANDYFSKNMHLVGILSTPNRINNEKQLNQIRNSWLFGHSKDSNGVVVLDNDMKYQPVSQNSKDSQLLESRVFNIQDIARYFNINPVLLGDLSHSSYSTIEASLLEFATHTLYPYITLVENELCKKLLMPNEKDLYIDLDDNFILKSDKSTQANYLSALKNAGIITINEARQQLGLNNVDGGDNLMVNFTNIEDNKINTKPIQRND